MKQKKLKLSKETLRAVSRPQLNAIAGGFAGSFAFSDCFACEPSSPFVVTCYECDLETLGC